MLCLLFNCMFSSKNNLFSLNHFKFACMSVCTQVVYSPQIESFSWLLDLFFLETMLKVQTGVPAAVCWLFIIYLNKSTLKVSVGEVDMVAFMNWCRVVRLVAAHCREWNHCLSQRLWVCGECPEKKRHCAVTFSRQCWWCFPRSGHFFPSFIQQCGG